MCILSTCTVHSSRNDLKTTANVPENINAPENKLKPPKVSVIYAQRIVESTCNDEVKTVCSTGRPNTEIR